MDSPGSATRIILEGLMHRGELANLELRDARSHIATTGVVVGVAGALALLGGLAGTLAIAALVWERADRALILGLVGLGYLLGAGALGWWAAVRVRSWRPFAETRYQLQEDCACLSQSLPTRSP